MTFALRLLETKLANRNASSPELTILAVEALAEYGRTDDATLIPRLLSAYEELVPVLSPEERKPVLSGLISRIEHQESTHIALLPIVEREPELALASWAAFALIANSPEAATGLPAGLHKLVLLIERGLPTNIGAVFGGAVALGDIRLRQSLDLAEPHLRPEDLQVAARVSSKHMQDAAIDFWLSLAERKISSLDQRSQSAVRSAASALILYRQKAEEPVVYRTTRRYPAHEFEQPIEAERTWSFDDYAAELEPRLQELVYQERPPSIFRAVKRDWGLKAVSVEEENEGFAEDGRRTFWS